MRASHHAVTSAGLAAALALLVPATSSAQAGNPAARGANTTPRVAIANRRPLVVTERVASGFSPFSPACGDLNGTVYIGAEVEPHIAINPLNPNHLVAAWQQDRYSNGGARGLVSAASFDGGTTWTQSTIPASACTGGEYARSTDPWVTFGPDGTVYQTALSISGTSFTPTGVNAILVARSTDGGITWAPPVTVIRDGGDLFNDKQTITADPLDARFVYAVWDRLRAGANGPSLFARTTDRGETWEAAREIHDPGSTHQTIGNLIRVLPDGTLVNLFTQLNDLPGGGSSASLNVIRSSDRGLTWSAPILLSAMTGLGARDPTTGERIRDGSIIPQMAVARDGSLHVVWQDARFTQLRDAIALSRSTDGGFTWSAPVRVNANPNVWAFTPQVHVRDDGTIGVTYYDLRSDTSEAATLMTDFWLARSSDGVNWTETRVSPAFDIATAPNAGGYFLGDYTGLVSAGADFIAFYTRTTGNLLNRTDAIAARIAAPPALALKRLVEAEPPAAYRAAPMPAEIPGPEFQARVSENIARAMERRVPGWSSAKGRLVP